MEKRSGNKERETNNHPNKNDEKGGKKDKASNEIVLEVDLHCDGCATKVYRTIRGLQGVESVRGGDKDPNKLTVIGKLDPVELREKLKHVTKKNVEIISPSQKKDKDKNNGEKKKNSDENQNEKNNAGAGDKPAKKPDEKKIIKEPAVTTVVLKVSLHCEGCIKKIQKVVRKTKGYQDMEVDRQKDLITVRGTVDGKALAEAFKGKLKKVVEIVPPKKEKNEAAGGGSDSGKGGKAAGGGGDGGWKVEGNKTEWGYPSNPYPYPIVHGSGYVAEHVHAPSIFSDENPNACSIM
ncbi:hypothetical protein RJ639_015322 [Escallonia herrerae]|uniref:HMA domain-containing protein n=1 Tax=Escallonia herrerae TaxID=1293975 RepID=A0AA88VJ75_9ASTE|nr:hypothetical protein RJ639_015322 [Escallonia herrerae]